MSNILAILHAVHQTVHQNQLSTLISVAQKPYSTPSIYCGGINISPSRKISKEEELTALSKAWYIHYKYRNPETGKLERMPNIKANVNRLKSFRERLSYLKVLRDTLEYLLERGANPFSENNLEQLISTHPVPRQQKKVKLQAGDRTTKKVISKEVAKEETALSTHTVKEAIDFALEIKKSSIAQNSYRNFELRIRKFLTSNDLNAPITVITKRTVIEYLNSVLLRSSPRNRNNTRTDLSSLFQVLEDNEIIPTNFVKSINILQSKPERNKTYTPTLQNEIYEYLEQNDPLLLLYIKFISYNFLRPVEVNRLRVRDIDIADKKLYIRTKNKAVKVKIIPDILIEDLPDLSMLNPDHFLFAPTGFGQPWNAEENNRRDHFSKRFKEVVKDHFSLGIDYGLYSFRHTFITKLYRNLRLQKSQYETKNILMGITGHLTMKALEQYLRDIDAEMPEDYSSLLR